MNVGVHDLLCVRSLDDLVYDGPLPLWLREALAHAPWVVVRRAQAIGDLIPVGIRGACRAERFAALLPASSIVTRITPEDLVSPDEINVPTYRDQPALTALSRACTLLRDLDVAWGPVGSVGFELASGSHVVHAKSDLDLIVRRHNLLVSEEILDNLLNLSMSTQAAIDILIETDENGFSLLDYAKGEETLVVRTPYGPRLISHPMKRLEIDLRTKPSASVRRE